MKKADYRTIYGLCVCVCEYICNKWKHPKIKWFGWQVQWYWFGFCIFIPNHLQQMSTDFAIRKKRIYILKKASLEQSNLGWEPGSVRVHLAALPRGHRGSLICTRSSRNIRASASVYSEWNLRKELETPDRLAYAQQTLMPPPQSRRGTNLLQEHMRGYLLGTCGFLEKISTFQKQERSGR